MNTLACMGVHTPLSPPPPARLHPSMPPTEEQKTATPVLVQAHSHWPGSERGTSPGIAGSGRALSHSGNGNGARSSRTHAHVYTRTRIRGRRRRRRWPVIVSIMISGAAAHTHTLLGVYDFGRRAWKNLPPPLHPPSSSPSSPPAVASPSVPCPAREAATPPTARLR